METTRLAWAPAPPKNGPCTDRSPRPKRVPAGGPLSPALSCLFLLALSGASPGPPLPPQARAIQDAIDEAEGGAVLHLPAGRIKGSLRVDKPLTILGAGPKRTFFVVESGRPGLVVWTTGGTVQVQGMTFTTAPNGRAGRGAGVHLKGPGKVILRDVVLRKTIVGRCLSSPINAIGEVELQFERVRILDHECFMAGVLVINPGVRATFIDSQIEGNTGELAGALLMTGGLLRLEDTVLRRNRFARGEDGHHLVVASGERARIELVRTTWARPERESIIFEKGVKPDVRIVGADWPEEHRPEFVKALLD